MTPAPSRRVRAATLRAARTLTVGTAIGALVLTTPALEAGSVGPGQPSPSAGQSPQLVPAALVVVRKGRTWPGHPGRRVIGYRVHQGDSATRIAVRFHAWTAELLRINHKTPGSVWYVGERVRVPVVVKRARAHGHAVGAQHHGTKHPAKRHHPRKHHPKKHHTSRPPASHPSRATVRDEVIRVARHYGVRQRLVLAIAWQESGWQQHVRSSVGAVGTMQVMPGTGRWISSLVGHRLHLRSLHDNVVAGVVLFRLLREDHSVKRSLAGYYQGLGSVQKHGYYPSTRRYIRAVTSHWARLNHGWHPLR